ncbi:UNVERIFIED_CONTAM: hypothetical protein HDU68_009864 [Siphonaria sp. JEL0065]|nr:hypothetical protein HDU68_009864 [Siphonaria sp. JEL0065]
MERDNSTPQLPAQINLSEQQNSEEAAPLVPQNPGVVVAAATASMTKSGSLGLTMESPRKSKNGKKEGGGGMFKKEYKLVSTKIIDEDERNEMAPLNPSSPSGGGGGGVNVNESSAAMPPPFDPQAQAARQSHTSFTSSAASIGLSKFPHAQEVSETVGSKSKEIGLIFLILLLNVLLVVLGDGMSHNGLTIMVSPTVVEFAGGVVIEILLLLTNALTILAMDIGASIFLAHLIVKKKGYSMAGCGFMQSAPFHRLQFTGKLSLNSPCRKNLQRVAYLWTLAETMKLLSPIGATGVLSSSVRTHADSVNCIVYHPSNLRDRKYPTFISSAGVAEFLFGNALGCMRSERSDCPDNGSQYVFGPQLDGVVGSGDTILGQGFQMIIASTCQCTDVASPYVIQSNIMSLQEQKTMLTALQNLSTPFLIAFESAVITDSNMTTHAAIGNMQICGGVSDTVVPVCQTSVGGFQDSRVAATFMTDGTTASIALVNSVAESVDPWPSVISAASIQYAMNAIWPPGQVFPLVSNVAGMMNALLYWCSSDLVAVDPTLLEPGFETTYSILLRAGMQRTWDSKGSTCIREISRNDQTIVHLTPWGSTCIYIAGGLQIVLSLLALLAGSVWYFSDIPLGPAIRVIRQPTYFMSVLCESPFAVNLVGTGNAQEHVIWQAIDVIVRIGEAFETMDEPVGRIKMERSKLVRPLTNGRMYA